MHSEHLPTKWLRINVTTWGSSELESYWHGDVVGLGSHRHAQSTEAECKSRKFRATLTVRFISGRFTRICRTHYRKPQHTDPLPAFPLSASVWRCGTSECSTVVRLPECHSPRVLLRRTSVHGKRSVLKQTVNRIARVQRQ